MNEAIIKFEGLPAEPSSGESALFHNVLRALQCSPARWNQLMGCINDVTTLSACYRRMEEKSRTLEGQFELLMKLMRHVCCSANLNFSRITIDELSDDSQVNLEEFVIGLGGDYVDGFSVPPGKKIRLQHPERPGWTPVEIRIDLNLAGGASNYLDFHIQFYLGPGDKQLGKPIGPLYKGNQFLNKDGTQIKLPFPKYKGEPIDVGSLERLAVEISNKSGGVNLDSAQIVILFDNDRFYKMCAGSLCKPGCEPDSSCPSSC